MDRPTPSRPPEPHLILRLFRGWRIALGRLIGITTETRAKGVREMIARHGKDRVSYWFQLLVAMGIATYGLVLGSTGVVIGAMLVSPLMGPILEIGMGLVTGSPVLVLHAATRTVASIVIVVVGSALLTLGVPYHELNGEILARTSPTLIDLYVASFCALAAAYTTVRQSSDTISAAAGTAISIALVPPLCVVGWGFGSAHFEVSRGAALLFTANLCAILLFAAVVFFLLAYDTVDAHTLEREAAGEGTLLNRMAGRLRSAFGAAYGPVLRLSMPLVLIGPVYFPLRHALEEVAWKVRVRDEVARALDELPSAKQAVRSNVEVERRGVTVRLVIVGDYKAATKLKADLTARISAAAGLSPTVDIVAVADSEAVRAASQTASLPIVALSAPPISDLRRNLDEDVRRWWPTSTAGELGSWSLVVGNDGRTTLRTNHFGQPLGTSGEALLASTLRDGLGVDVLVKDIAVPTDRIVLHAGEEKVWIEQLADLVGTVSQSGLGHVCVTVPQAPKARDRSSESANALRGSIEVELRRLSADRVTVEVGETFSAQATPTRCATKDADAGVKDAAASD